MSTQGTATSPELVHKQWTMLAWLAVALLLMIGTPLFLCQHIPNDAAYYDVQARCVLEGGMLYRDIVEPNLPGIVWVHMAIRSLCGWSTATLRLFDLLFLGATAALLVRWNHVDRKQPLGIRGPLLVLAIFWTHFSLTEWCHCQRDGWMLLPAMGALLCRDRNLAHTMSQGNWRALCVGSVVEGLLWGAAFWLKPHVAVPAVCVCMASLLWGGCTRRMVGSVAGVLTGGMLIGAAGSLWLIESGTWPHFWEMQLEWNPEYLAAGRSRASFGWWITFFNVFTPWTWGHLVAIPCALLTLFQGIKSPHFRNRASSVDPVVEIRSRRNLLISALYFGWVLQTVLLQFPFVYIQVPTLILALGISAGIHWRAELAPMAKLGYAMTFLIALLGSPGTSPARIAHWWECVTLGPIPQVRSKVQFEMIPDWKELPYVFEFLREQQVSGTDVLAYDAGLVLLYNELDLRPPNRYVYTDVHARLFKSHLTEIEQTLEASPHRYVVSSLYETHLSDEDLRDIDPATNLPRGMSAERLSQFPFNQPVLFRHGKYVVHRAVHPIGPLCTTYPDRNNHPDQSQADSPESQPTPKLTSRVPAAVSSAAE